MCIFKFRKRLDALDKIITKNKWGTTTALELWLSANKLWFFSERCTTSVGTYYYYNIRGHNCQHFYKVVDHITHITLERVGHDKTE